MRCLFPALVLALGTFSPTATVAVELDAETELLIRCGAGYIIVANDDAYMDTAEEAENLRGIGLHLLEQADAILTAQGVSDADREKAGADLTTEVAEALDANTDPGFETAQCVALVEAAVKAAAGPDAPDIVSSEEVDKLMICGAGFYVTAEAAKEDGDAETAGNLGALAEILIGRAEALMIEAGMDEQARFELSQRYGQMVGETIYAGEELSYDWETCAMLAG